MLLGGRELVEAVGNSLVGLLGVAAGEDVVDEGLVKQAEVLVGAAGPGAVQQRVEVWVAEQRVQLGPGQGRGWAESAERISEHVEGQHGPRTGGGEHGEDLPGLLAVAVADPLE
jgi:hypothetical protein